MEEAKAKIQKLSEKGGNPIQANQGGATYDRNMERAKVESDRMEQDRKNCLKNVMIYKSREEKGEDTKAMAEGVLEGLGFNKNTVKYAHRVGRQIPNSLGMRPILVGLGDADMADRVLSSFQTVAKEGIFEAIVMAEDLPIHIRAARREARRQRRSVRQHQQPRNPQWNGWHAQQMHPQQSYQQQWQQQQQSQVPPQGSHQQENNTNNVLRQMMNMMRQLLNAQ